MTSVVFELRCVFFRRKRNGSVYVVTIDSIERSGPTYIPGGLIVPRARTVAGRETNNPVTGFKSRIYGGRMASYSVKLCDHTGQSNQLQTSIQSELQGFFTRGSREPLTPPRLPGERGTAADIVVRTSAAFRSLIIHQNEPARQRARELVNTPEFAHAQRQRKKVEALFAELKNQIGLRRLRLRRLRFVREQFFLAAAAAQNIKRLVRFLGQRKNQRWRRLSNLDHQNSHYRNTLASKEPLLNAPFSTPTPVNNTWSETSAAAPIKPRVPDQCQFCSPGTTPEDKTPKNVQANRPNILDAVARRLTRRAELH
jgi:hypothetical protein